MVSASSTSIPTITLGALGLFSDFPDFLAGTQHLVVESSLSHSVQMLPAQANTAEFGVQ